MPSNGDPRVSRGQPRREATDAEIRAQWEHRAHGDWEFMLSNVQSRRWLYRLLQLCHVDGPIPASGRETQEMLGRFGIATHLKSCMRVLDPHLSVLVRMSEDYHDIPQPMVRARTTDDLDDPWGLGSADDERPPSDDDDEETQLDW